MNEISTKSSSPVIAAVERCLSQTVDPRKSWYQDYTVPGTYVKDTGIKQVEKVRFQVGDEVSSIEAVSDPVLINDTRPRFFDNISKTWTLLDTGSCVSCTAKEPGDKLDPNVRLRAVNGQSIPTFG